MAKDWRSDILETIPELRGQSFTRKVYTEYRPGWDHDHCAVCGVKFAEHDIEGEEVLHEGYAVTADYLHGADYEWVCPACFEVSKVRMNWSDVAQG